MIRICPYKFAYGKFPFSIKEDRVLKFLILN